MWWRKMCVVSAQRQVSTRCSATLESPAFPNGRPEALVPGEPLSPQPHPS